VPIELAAWAVVSSLALVAPGPPGRADEAGSGLSVHESVGFVLLPITVTTPKGRPITGLSREDFRLFDDGSPREIEFFAKEADLPVAIAFVLDVSGSMEPGGKLERAQAAIRSFIEDLDPGDQVGMICFADDQVTWVTPFTADYGLFLRRLDVQEAYGSTALYDALAASPTLVDDAIRGRRAIVLLTDGLDNASELSTMEATWIARRVQVPIYVVDLVSTDPDRLRRRDRENVAALGRFARETGGAVWPVRDEGDLAIAVAAIQDELRFQYVIGFTARSGSTRFRPVRVETERAHARIRTRAGYYADP
jgi:Ca-activated chloride channel family protein